MTIEFHSYPYYLTKWWETYPMGLYYTVTISCSLNQISSSCQRVTQDSHLPLLVVAVDPRATRGLGLEFWPRFKNKTPADPLIPLAQRGLHDSHRDA